MQLSSLLLRMLWILVRAPMFLLLASVSPKIGLKILSETVAIYIRWSTDEQSQGTTLDIQRDACRNQARAWQFGEIPDERIFIDDGYSGGTLERPAMDKLRAMVKQGKVNCVIVYKIDRLSRNIVDATSLVLREWDGKCHLKCVMDPVDTTTDLGRMIFSMLAMFADFERGQIRARTVAGKLRRAGEGNNITSAPYGYARVDKRLVVVEREAAVVRQIFDWYLNGMGIGLICKRLSEEGAKTQDGYSWGRSSIGRLLANETYKGTHFYGKHRMGKDGEAERVRRDEPLIKIDNHVPAIIDPETWDRVAEMRKDRRTRMEYGGRTIGSQHLLSGLARCRCGAPYISKQDHTGTWYYLCSRRRDNGGCDCMSIPHKYLHGFILSELDQLHHPDTLAHIANQSSGYSRRKLDELRLAHLVEDGKLKRIAQEIEKIDRDYRAGRLSPERYERNIAAAEREQADVTENIQTLIAAVAEAETATNRHQRLVENVSRLKLWDQLNIQVQRDLLRSIVTKLTVYRNPKDRSVEIDMHVDEIPLSHSSNPIDE